MDRVRLSWDLGDGQQTRNAERYAVSVPVRLRPDGTRTLTVCVGDISATGFMALSDQPIALGACVSVDLPGLGATHARVRWAVGSRVGARFLTPIDVTHCRREMMLVAHPLNG